MKKISFHNCWGFFFFESMATLRNKRKLAAVSRDLQKLRTASHRTHPFPELPRSTSRRFLRRLRAGLIKNCPRNSTGQSRILGAFSKLVEFLINPQVRTFSGTVPGTFRNSYVENQDPGADRSRSDPHPEVEFSTHRTSNSVDSDLEDTYHNAKSG